MIKKLLITLLFVSHLILSFGQVNSDLDDKVNGSKFYTHFRVAINFGRSWKKANPLEVVPSEYDEYMKDLRSGYHYGLDLSYYFSEKIGIGFNYNVYRSKNEMDHINVPRPDGLFQIGKMSDDISIKFIGPFLSTRLFNVNKKNSLLLNMGIGYLGIKNDAVRITNYTFTGSTAGIYWDIGYDIGISDVFAIGFQLTYMMGTLTKYELSDGYQTQTVKLKKGSYEGLSRIDLSIGLRLIK